MNKMKFSVLSEDINDSRYILVECKYGICRVKKQHFNKGHKPTIMSALDKTKFFWNKVKEKNPYIYNNFTLKSDYISNLKKIVIESEGVNFKMTPNKILNNFKPGFKSCCDRAKYFIQKANKIHNHKYDYNLVNYINSKTKVKIICQKHGMFEQKPTNHLSGKGCLECGRESTRHHVLKNNRSSLSLKHWKKSKGTPKIYLLQCWNENEKFYKIGKTHQGIKQRFDSKKLMPYNYKVLDLLYSDAETISNIESSFKKFCNYEPNIKFSGYSECLTELPLQVNLCGDNIISLIKNFKIKDLLFKKIESNLLGNYKVIQTSDFFILNFLRYNIFIKIMFYKNSYSDYDFYNGYGYVVTPQKKTITVFE